MKKLRVALVGIGGMGRSHLNNLKRLTDSGKIDMVAACDKNLEANRKNLTNFGFQDIRTYDDFDTFLEAEKGRLDLMVICTPIPLHKEMCCKALEAGYDIMLEKPPAVTIQDIDEMLDAKKRTGKICAVGFQLTAYKSFIEFKKRIAEGKVGKINKIATMGLWKRTHAYFSRSPWVGKLLFQGNYVLDGTVNNPFAHLLNNCLILAGLQEGSDPAPVWAKAELYRANNIESEDTSCLRIQTKGGIEVMFFAAISCRENTEPFIQVDGTEGSAIWEYDGRMKFMDKEGNVTEEYQIASNAHADLYDRVTDYMLGISNWLPCSLEETRNFVLASNLSFESSGKTHAIDKKYLVYYNGNEEPTEKIVAPEDYVYLKGIEKVVKDAMRERKLYSEMQVEWAVETKPFQAEEYKAFAKFR